MTLRRGGNAKFSSELPFENGDVIEEWNLVQIQPHTPICVGVSALTFRKCNLTNCDVPVDAVVDDCAVCHVSFCAKANPDWAFLPPEPENCQHVVDTDEVWIDGQLVDTIYHYEDTVL